MKYAAELCEHVRCGSRRPSPGELGEENAAPAQRPAGTAAGYVLLPFHQPPPRMALGMDAWGGNAAFTPQPLSGCCGGCGTLWSCGGSSSCSPREEGEGTWHSFPHQHARFTGSAASSPLLPAEEDFFIKKPCTKCVTPRVRRRSGGSLPPARRIPVTRASDALAAGLEPGCLFPCRRTRGSENTSRKRQGPPHSACHSQRRLHSYAPDTSTATGLQQPPRGYF